VISLAGGPLVPGGPAADGFSNNKRSNGSNPHPAFLSIVERGPTVRSDAVSAALIVAG
jgi:hypothetical protein